MEYKTEEEGAEVDTVMMEELFPSEVLKLKRLWDILLDWKLRQISYEINH